MNVNELLGNLQRNLAWGDILQRGKKLNIINTCGRYKMASISQTIISKAFRYMKKVQYRFKLHWIKFLLVTEWVDESEAAVNPLAAYVTCYRSKSPCDIYFGI